MCAAGMMLDNHLWNQSQLGTFEPNSSRYRLRFDRINAKRLDYVRQTAFSAEAALKMSMASERNEVLHIVSKQDVLG